MIWCAKHINVTNGQPYMRCHLAQKAPQGTKLMIISKEGKMSLGAMPELACKLTQDFDITLQVGQDVWSK